MTTRRTARRPLSAALGLVLLAVALAWPMHGARAEYRLQAGDVLEISVAGIPELKLRVPVQLDGTIMFPLAGALMAEGASLAQMRSRVQSAIASKVFRVRTSDGRELSRTIERDDIATVIVEYKPIFVGGDVARQGEQGYRPRMRVRQALAAAGGTQLLIRGTADVAVLRSEFVTAWLNVVSVSARVWRIRTELGEKIAFDTQGIPPAPVPDTTVSQILDVETELRSTRNENHGQTKAYLVEAIQLVNDQIAALFQEQKSEEYGVSIDKQEHQKARDAFSAGNLPSRRVNDQRRAALMSSTRLLQTTSQLALALRTLAEHKRDLQKIESQRRIQLLADLQESTVKLGAERSKLNSAMDRLQGAGIRIARLSDRPPGKLELTITRNRAGRSERISASLDTELEPGDVIEVTNGQNVI